MIYLGERRWLTFNDCYRDVDAGYVYDGGLALDISGSSVERPLTEQEKDDINEAAEDYSGDK